LLLGWFLLAYLSKVKTFFSNGKFKKAASEISWQT
jgi:hypothetical protein